MVPVPLIMRRRAGAHAFRISGSGVRISSGAPLLSYCLPPWLRSATVAKEANQTSNWAKAVYNFRWTPQTDPSGVVHKTIDYPGVPIDHGTIQENHGILKNVRIPIRPHFGVIGLAPKEADMVDSIPPSYTGGNIDNWRIGKGDHVLSSRG